VSSYTPGLILLKEGDEGYESIPRFKGIRRLAKQTRNHHHHHS
jgi:hypothetical protein